MNMKKNNIMKNLTKLTLVMLAVFMPAFNLNAQILGRIKKTIRDTTEIVTSAGVLVNSVKRTTQEFDKSVAVDNSKTPKPTVAQNQLTKPKFKKGAFTNFDWEPVSFFDGQLFPSMIISMADYKGDIQTPTMHAIKSSALGFRFNSKQAYIPIKWEIESTDKTYFDKIGGDYVFQQAGQERYFMPDIPWNMAALAKQTSSTPLNVIFRLIDEDGNKVEKSVPLFLRSVNDCIFRYKDLKLTFLFAAYIQEQHPEVDKILRKALDTKTVPAISGYQGDDLNTIKQVAAVWRVLHDRGFQYSNITTTSTESSQDLASQQVRTFENAIKTNQANCVDGVVVLASILRAMGISTDIVLVPGHAFLGVYTSDKKDKVFHLETTMLSSNSELIQQAKTPKQKDEAYKKQFLQAVDSGNKTYEKYKATNDVTRIDVDAFRKFVRPLPFSQN